MLRVERHPRGPRAYVGGKRLHHGTAGLIAVLLATLLRRHRRLSAAIAAGGGAAIAHDRKDFPWTDGQNH